MSRRSWILAIVVALLVPFVAALALGVGVQSSRAEGPMGLYVVFHTDHTITVNLAGGAAVGSPTSPGTTIPPGKWDVFMDDSLVVEGPQFDVSGPGVNLVENMFFGEDPSETFTVTFLPNSIYTWRNDEQPTRVFFFNTFAAAASSSSSSSSSGSSTSGTSSTGSKTGKSTATSTDVVGSGIKAAAPFRGTLAGTVSSAGKLTLTLKGKGVTNLKYGRYTVAVSDKTSKNGFTVQELRKSAQTLSTVPFVGKRTVTVDFKVGQWMFYSASGKKNFFLVVG